MAMTAHKWMKANRRHKRNLKESHAGTCISRPVVKISGIEAEARKKADELLAGIKQREIIDGI